MAELKPFRALRPLPMFASQISSRPYDVVTDSEAKELIKDNEISFLRVTRSDIVCESSTPYAAQVYDEASNFLNRMKNEDCFIKEDEEKLYVYELQFEGRSQTGIAATFSVSDYDNNIILKHEHTRIEKEEDRTNHIITTKAQTGPAYLTYRNRSLIDSTVAEVKLNKTLFHFVDEEKVTHLVWEVPQELCKVLIDEFAKLDHLYIADGHHRSASASNVKQKLNLPDNHPASYFLGVAFPENQLKLGSCNRLILSDIEINEVEFLNKLTKSFNVNVIENPDQTGIKMFIGNDWYSLEPVKYMGNNPVEHIDSYIVQELIFKDILNIKDPRTSGLLDYIRNNKGTKILEDKVRSGEAFAAITIEPVTIETIMDIAESGEIMPPKSTWFFPKMRDGLLIHEID